MSEGYTRNGVEYGARPSPMPSNGPSEASEHVRVASALRRAGVYFVHVPMGGARGRSSGAELRRMGASKGFPDLLILDPPQHLVVVSGSDTTRCCGVALELKRCVRGSTPTADQVEHLERLAERGWLATVQWGADAALEYLRRVGCGV